MRQKAHQMRRMAPRALAAMAEVNFGSHHPPVWHVRLYGATCHMHGYEHRSGRSGIFTHFFSEG